MANKFFRYALPLLLASIVSCSDGGSDTDANYGSETSLFPDRESFLSQNLEDHPLAITLVEAESIKTEVPPMSAVQSLMAKNAASPTDAALLANYKLYPSHTISSRVIGVSVIANRDECLSKCLGSSRCGAVTYSPMGALGYCNYHGPTQSIDKLVPITTKGKSHDTAFDTYIITARNQDYIEDSYVYWKIKVSNGDSTNASPQMKVLFQDGTATPWKDLGAMQGADPYGDLEESEFFSWFPAPNKPIEGVVLSIDSSDGVGVGTINAFGMDCTGDCSYPSIHNQIIAWYMIQNTAPGHEPLRLDNDCDANLLDGCAATMAFRLTDISGNNEFDPYEDGYYLSLPDLQKATDSLVW